MLKNETKNKYITQQQTTNTELQTPDFEIHSLIL